MFSDPQEVVKVNKVLSVIFILLICPVNLFLLILQLRKPLFYQNIKAMLIISLTIGDFVLAIFPLVVIARTVFEIGFYVMPCRLFTAYVTYYSYLIHFVYGVGLILLGTEVLLRQRNQTFFKKSSLALGAGSVPWIFGLVIILPLCMDRIDYGDCLNYQSMDSMIGVSVFMPASLALVVNIIFSCLNLSSYEQRSVQAQQPSVTYSVRQAQSSTVLPGPTGAVPGHQQNESTVTHQRMAPYAQTHSAIQWPAGAGARLNYQTNQSTRTSQHSTLYAEPYTLFQEPTRAMSYRRQHNDLYYEPTRMYSQVIDHDNTNPHFQPNTSSLPYRLTPNQLYGQQDSLQYSTNQRSNPQIDIHQQGALVQTPTGGVGNATGNSTASPQISNRGKELAILFFITLVYFVMVVPNAVVCLKISNNSLIWLDERTFTTVTLLVQWLMIARSFVTPLIMFTCQNL